MRFSMTLTAFPTKENTSEELYIPINYVGPILKAIKIGLKKSNYGFYQKMYTSGNTLKTFSMAVTFPNAEFKNKKIYLKTKEDNIILHFSSNNLEAALNYFNAFKTMQLTHKDMPINNQVHFVANEIHREKEPTIKSDAIIVKAVSPIVLQQGQKGQFINFANTKTNKYTADVADFQKALKTSIKHHLINKNLAPMVDSFEILPVQTRATVLNLFGQYTAATTGTFAMQGHPELLNDLVQNGLGSKRGCFNGMIRLVKEI